MNPNDIFWLARYAYNTLDPLITEAKQYEPSIFFKIEMVFGRVVSWSPTGSEVNIQAHWDRKQPIMFLNEYSLSTKEKVDVVAAKVQRFICAEQAAVVKALPPLETSIPA